MSAFHNKLQQTSASLNNLECLLKVNLAPVLRCAALLRMKVKLYFMRDFIVP